MSTLLGASCVGLVCPRTTVHVAAHGALQGVTASAQYSQIPGVSQGAPGTVPLLPYPE